MVLHRHHGHLLDRGPELIHVALNHHGVVSGIESADRKIEVCIGGKRDKFIALPGIDARHRFEAERHAAFHPSGGDRLPGGLKTQASGCASALDAFRWLWAQAEKVLYHAGRFQLPREVVREIGADCARDHVLGEPRQVPQGVVVCLFDHQTKILVGMGLREFRDASADHIDRFHGRRPFRKSTMPAIGVPGPKM